MVGDGDSVRVDGGTDRIVRRSSLALEEKADDVEPGLDRPADLVEGEATEIIAARQGAPVREEELQHVYVAAAAGDVHQRFSEFVRRVL